MANVVVGEVVDFCGHAMQFGNHGDIDSNPGFGEPVLKEVVKKEPEVIGIPVSQSYRTGT